MIHLECADLWLWRPFRARFGSSSLIYVCVIIVQEGGDYGLAPEFDWRAHPAIFLHTYPDDVHNRVSRLHRRPLDRVPDLHQEDLSPADFRLDYRNFQSKSFLN